MYENLLIVIICVPEICIQHFIKYFTVNYASYVVYVLFYVNNVTSAS